MALYERHEALLASLQRIHPGDNLWRHRYALALWQKAELLVALGRDAEARAALARSSTLLGMLTQQDPSNHEWQVDRTGVEAKRIALDAGAADTAARMLDRAREFDSLAALDPNKAHVPGLAAAARVGAAAAQLRANRLVQAQATLEPALDRLERLHADAPTVSGTRDALAMGWLLAADLHVASKDPAGASQACARTRDLLAPAVTSSTDYRILAPWVLSQHCLGTPTLARAQQDRLSRMGYRATTYLRKISMTTAQGGKR